MPHQFDAYLKWLAIPPQEQPPNHYRLLGVPPFMDDAEVIENAADQRMSHVRTFQGGSHAETSQRILNQISTAKVVLLNPGKKGPLRRPTAGRARQRSEPFPVHRTCPGAAVGGAETIS